MKLTTKGRYAVTAMLDLALHTEADSPVSVCDIARRQHISPAYLERLFAGLRRAGLITATRGACGGYRLAKPAPDISVAVIMSAVSEDLDATRCGGKRNCRDGEGCLTHDLWEDLTRHVEDYLNGVSLADLARRGRSHRTVTTSEVPLQQVAGPMALR